MKVFKKIISFILTAAIMMSMICVGTVSAGAESTTKPTVHMTENDKYVIVTFNFPASWLETFQNSEKEDKSTQSYFELSIGSYYCFKILMEDNNGNFTYNVMNFNDCIPTNKYSVRAGQYENRTDYGIIFYFKKTEGEAAALSHFAPLSKCNFTYFISCKNGKHIISGSSKPKEISLKSNDSEIKNISTLSFSKVSNYTYTGKARKPSVTIKDGDYTLKKGTDYTLSYKNNKDIGTATITIKGKGDYTGTKTIQFKIVPKKSTLKVTKKSDTKAKFTWAAVNGAEKYQIYYSTDGKKYKKLATISGSKTSATISKLDFEKYDYKFKIRSYGTDNSKKYYSSFSKTVTVK